MLIETLGQRFRKARTTNATGSFPTKVPVLQTAPALDDATATGQSAFHLAGPQGEYVQNGVIFVCYGAGSNNNTGKVRLYGWRSVHSPTDFGNLNILAWIPVLLVEVAITLSSTMVIATAGGTIATTDLFADTITLTTGNANVSVDIVSPTGDAGIAHVVADFKGFQYLEFTFDTNSSSTNLNVLFALL